MDRLVTLEKTRTELGAILGFETHFYQPKVEQFPAIKYDGSLEMAVAIDEYCKYSYCCWDKGENFCGLYAKIKEGSVAVLVNEGDYLVKQKDGWYKLVTKRKFEDKFEIIL